jgi:hypothetical protein
MQVCGGSVKGDVWSFGVTAWEILAMGAQPYSEFTADDDILAAIERGYRYP